MSNPQYDNARINLHKWIDRSPVWAERLKAHLQDTLDPVLADLGLDSMQALADRLGEALESVFYFVQEDFLAQRFDLEGQTAVDAYLARNAYKESGSGVRFLEAIRDSSISAFELVEIVPGSHVVVQDRLRPGDPVRTDDHSLSLSARPYMYTIGRFVTVDDRPMFTGACLPLHHDQGKAFCGVIAKALSASLPDLSHLASEKGIEAGEALLGDVTTAGLLRVAGQTFVRVWAHTVAGPLPKMVNYDGEAIVLTTIRFPVKGDPAAIAAALDGCPELDRHENEAAWSWVSEPTAAGKKGRGKSKGPGGERVAGFLDLSDRALTVQTNSIERANRIEARLEVVLEGLVGSPLRSIQTPEQAVKEHRRKPNPLPATPNIPPEELNRIIHAELDRHYRETLDQPVPALGNKTPRQAVKSAKGRQAAIDWLKGIESRSGSVGGDQMTRPYDFAWIWAELGIERP